MAIVGYARVSTTGQSLDVQLDRLRECGCDEIFKERLSGTTATRPKLKECLTYLRKGDTLVVTKLDRLARSTLDLHKIVDGLHRDGVDFKVLDQSIDTSTKEGKLLFTMLAAIAEFETELRKARQMEGIAKAKQNGVRFGRNAKLSNDQIAEMRRKRAGGTLIRELMEEYDLSKASVYRLLGDQGDARPQPSG
jgi:DNA invertase Pin-like site-specific DNA recombinase